MNKSSRTPLLIIFVTVFIDLLGFGIVLPLLPRYAKHFQATGWELGLLMAKAKVPAVKPEHLGTLHTLRQIVEFLCAGEPAASAVGYSPLNPAADAAGSPGVDRVLPVRGISTKIGQRGARCGRG